MKYHMLAAIMILFCVPALAQESAEPNKEDGFGSLFDGKSFEGWRVNENTPKSWKIENGLLVLTGGRSHLFTEEPVEDFIIRFEWRPVKKGYNSGFLLRGRQIQMAQRGAGGLFGAEGPKGVPQLHKPPGEWNPAVQDRRQGRANHGAASSRPVCGDRRPLLRPDQDRQRDPG